MVEIKGNKGKLKKMKGIKEMKWRMVIYEYRFSGITNFKNMGYCCAVAFFFSILVFSDEGKKIEY